MGLSVDLAVTEAGFDAAASVAEADSEEASFDFPKHLPRWGSLR